MERGILVDVRKNLSGLIGFPLVHVLQQRYGVPVAIENDGRLYGMGEMLAGEARGVANMVCLTLGTGVGCCVAIGGYILRGRHGTGGVLGGHMTIDASGPVCTCGNIGCVEVRCSASGLVAAMTDRLASHPAHPLHAVRTLTPETVITAAAGGDDVAAGALAEYIRYLSAAVVSYIHVYDADLVLLGGGMMNAAAHILPPVQRYVLEHTWTRPPRTVPVKAAALGDRAALVGAAALAHGFQQFL